MCFQHFQKKYKLKLAKSSIPGAGLGLFTTARFPPGKRIGPYKGNIVDRDNFDPSTNPYGIARSDGKIVDAQSTQSCIARYANDCRKRDKDNKRCKGNNAILEEKSDKKIVLRAKRNTKNGILKGREVFASYGNEYWA